MRMQGAPVNRDRLSIMKEKQQMMVVVCRCDGCSHLALIVASLKMIGSCDDQQWVSLHHYCHHLSLYTLRSHSEPPAIGNRNPELGC